MVGLKKTSESALRSAAAIKRDRILKKRYGIQKCALPECCTRTKRQYCCEDHFKKHREQIKKARLARKGK